MTATIALARPQPHSDWLARLRTIGLALGGRGVLGAGLARSSVSAAEAAWWLAGGAPAPVAVYQPIGAASLAASYVNLANPGTYDATAPGNAPTLGAGGWDCNSANQEWLDTGITLANTSNCALAVRFSNAAVSNALLAGAFAAAGNRAFGIQPNRTTSVASWWNSISTSPVAGVSSGVMAIAANTAYLDGSAVGTVAAYFAWTANHTIYICSHLTGSQSYLSATVAAAVYWSDATGHATWMPSVMAAMAAL